MRTRSKIGDLIQSFNQEDLGILVLNMNVKTTVILFTLAAAIWSSVATAEYYRWKDSSGETQYGDHVPAEHSDQGHIKVDPISGQVVEEVPRARTPEEQRRFEEEQRIAKLEQQKKARQEAKDRVLLATFTSEEEIISVRDERISLIEQSIQLSRSRLAKQEKELVKLNASRNRFIDRDMEPPPWIERTELKVQARIAGIESYITDKGLEKEKLRRKFGEDLNRYRELTKRSLTSR